MPLLPVSDSRLPSASVLDAALAGLPASAPVVILLHGYRFSPSQPGSDPHLHILSARPTRACRKAVSWPRHLRLTGDSGLAIGFGWEATGSIWAAHAQAARAGRRLAILIGDLRRIAPDRPIHLMAHSLGARVAFCALPLLPRHAVQRLVLLAAALSLSEARAGLASPAGQTAQVFNVVGRENAVFDLLLRAALPLGGARLGRRRIIAANWLDLPLDTGVALRGLAGLGYPITPPAAWICHWSSYLRPDVWRLYRGLLLTPRQTPMQLLRDQLGPPAGAMAKSARRPLPFRRQSPS